jgi:FMN phosphatase YigB (HAD superfamily)
MNKPYDWMVFDYGGTLVTQPDKPDGDPPRMVNAYGVFLREWFRKRKRKIGKTSYELQKLTEAAHQAIAGRAGQLSLQDNFDYYVRWLRWIYRQSGITEYVPYTELESARLYLIEQAGKRLAPSASAATVAVLEKLCQAGFKLGLISNNSGYVEDLLYYRGIHHYFQFALDSARVRIIKPDRRIFDLAVEQFHLAGLKLLYVGDHFEADIVGATAAGWDAAWLNTNGTRRNLPPGAFTIHSLADLLKAKKTL